MTLFSKPDVDGESHQPCFVVDILVRNRSRQLAQLSSSMSLACSPALSSQRLQQPPDASPDTTGLALSTASGETTFSVANTAPGEDSGRRARAARSHSPVCLAFFGRQFFARTVVDLNNAIVYSRRTKAIAAARRVKSRKSRVVTGFRSRADARVRDVQDSSAGVW